MECEEFLELVWGERVGWVDLPAKVGSYWVPYHYKWEGDATEEITRRIDSCIRDGESLYFSVAMFRKRGRRIEDTMPTHWLWADLDETPPAEAIKKELSPTIAWESSPGRYQAMWKLHKKLSPSVQSKLNQALSYFLGADHGGWDLTQVLRLPGTRNFKYPGAPPVELLFHNEGLSYSGEWVWGKVRRALPTRSGDAGSGSGVDGARRHMPARARALLRVPADAVVEGERSSRLWELECLLAEAGWGEDDIYPVVESSAWNKWSGVATGENRLRYEIRKAIHHVRSRAVSERSVASHETRYMDSNVPSRQGSVDDAPVAESLEEEDDDSEATVPGPLPFIRYSSFMAMEMPPARWMVEDIWTAGSQGILGGEPKTSKSTLSLALGLSVASGRAFLDRYRVHTPGPVLMVQEENAPWDVQDKLRKLARLYGLVRGGDVRTTPAGRGSLAKRRGFLLDFPDEVPLRLLNNYGLNLALEEDRDAVWRECEAVQPVLLVLDPLYLIFAGVNYDKAHELAPYLKWLLALRSEFGCAICIVHHFRKQPVAAGSLNVRAGQRLMGNATLHGFVDSALYASAIDSESLETGWVGAHVEREFRSMEPQRALDVSMFFGRPGDLGAMKVEITAHDLTRTLVELVTAEPGITAAHVAEALGRDKRTVLGRARDSKEIEVVGGKRGRGHSWRLYPASSNGATNKEDDDE